MEKTLDVAKENLALMERRTMALCSRGVYGMKVKDVHPQSNTPKTEASGGV
jgi:hypothetical protein